MGGINSGARLSEARQVESSWVLEASEMYLLAQRTRTGIYSFADSTSRFRYTLQGDFLVVNFKIDDQEQTQWLRFSLLSLPWGKQRALFHCPQCQRSGYKLYLYHAGFLCRKCAGLRYELQCCHHRSVGYQFLKESHEDQHEEARYQRNKRRRKVKVG